MTTRRKLVGVGIIMGIVTAMLIWAATWGADPGPVTPTTTTPLTPITTTTTAPAALVTVPPDIDADPDLHRCLHSCEDTIHCGSARADSCACSYLCREYPNDPSKWNNCHGCQRLGDETASCNTIACECKLTGNPEACAEAKQRGCDVLHANCLDEPAICPTDPGGIPYCHSAGDCDSAETSCSWICCPDAPIAKLQGKKCCCPCVPDGNHSCLARQDQDEPCPCTIVTPQCCHGDQATSIGNLDVTTDGVTHKINCAWCALGIVTNEAEEAWCLAHCKDDTE